MKATKIFLAVIFIMAISFGVKAQDKYEYASITFRPGIGSSYGIYTTIAGKYSESPGKVSEGNSSYNLTPVIELLNKMSQEGWELYLTNGPDGGQIQYFYLRKKKS